MRVYHRVENVETAAKSASRTQREVDASVRCFKCTIYVFANAGEALEKGVSIFDNLINLAVKRNGKTLCIGCSKGK